MNSLAAPILQVEHLTKRFGGLTAVDDVSFKLKPGEILGIIGPNGSGKTTLFSLISGFLMADSGVVTLKGTNVSKRQPAALARKGLVRTFQIVQPFAEVTVEENVIIAGLLGGSRPLSEARAIAEEVLHFLELEPIVSRLAETLTIADRKKLEVARALACRPEVLLLDEVMAGLRPSEVDEAIERIKAIRARGISIILVEHLMRAVVALSDRLIVLRQGQVIAEGNDPIEVLGRHEVVEAYFGKAPGVAGS
ncbi:MAG: ABC transporter ATP-binding protein [Pseudomonadota bacterium]